jgi:SAM-dependent methyltransferase
MAIDYDHSRNVHSVVGARAALSILFGSNVPSSVLDVGCGTGTWMRAAVDLGVADVTGIDGIASAGESLLRYAVKVHDFSTPFNLRRRFDMAFCLEVAEHLPESCASGLISSIVAHVDTVLFSAACPGQPGQHHVNCQWPAYWQGIFNSLGFACSDSARWQIWADDRIEPWYRQNMFWARRDAKNAGVEARISPVLHPAFFHSMSRPVITKHMKRIEDGFQPLTWYVTVPPRAVLTKLARRVKWTRRNDETGSC